MKVTKGFISNSSSSSFICCYALITDIEKAKAYIEGNYDSEILSHDKVIKRSKSWCSFGADWAGVYCEPSLTGDSNDSYLIYESFGGAGDSDSDFYEDGWADYDVDFSDFEEEEQIFINGVTEDNGFSSKNIQIGYGAGRHG